MPDIISFKNYDPYIQSFSRWAVQVFLSVAYILNLGHVFNWDIGTIYPYK